MKWYSVFCLIGLSLLVFIQNSVQLSISSLQPFMVEIFNGINDFEVIAPSLSFLLVFLPLGLVTPYVNKYIPLLITLTFFSILTLVGSILRYCFVSNYAFFLSGTAMIAISAPFIMNNVSLIAQRLVSPNYQGTFNGFIQFIANASGTFGWLFTPLYITEKNDALYYLPRLELVYIVIEAVVIILFGIVHIALLCGVDKWDTEDTFINVITPRKMRYHPLNVRFGKIHHTEEDLPLKVSGMLKWYGAAQGTLNGIGELFNNSLQLMMMNSTLVYTNNDIFLAGICYYITPAVGSIPIGVLFDKLQKWGNFSIFLTILNALATFGLILTCNVNKILFYIFVTLFSLTSNNITETCLALVNVLLDKANSGDTGLPSTADGNSDQINSIFDWTNAAMTAIMLIVVAYVDMTIVNWILLGQTVLLSIAAISLLLRMPLRSQV